MERIKRKRILYTPGVISLVILSLIFIYGARHQLKVVSIGVIPLYMFDKRFYEQFPELICQQEETFPPKRDYTDIIFTGNLKDDNIKLAFAQIKIREILSADDSKNGLHFKFGKESNYETFVKTNDVLKTNNAKSYLFLDDDLWFYHFPPDTSNNNLFPETFYCTVINLNPKENWWTTLKIETGNIWRSSWHLLSCFFVFLVSILLLRKQNHGR